MYKLHQPVEKAATLTFRARFVEKIICTAKIRVREAGVTGGRIRQLYNISYNKV